MALEMIAREPQPNFPHRASDQALERAARAVEEGNRYAATMTFSDHSQPKGQSSSQLGYPNPDDPRLPGLQARISRLRRELEAVRPPDSGVPDEEVRRLDRAFLALVDERDAIREGRA
jgi:hypothetical protein